MNSQGNVSVISSNPHGNDGNVGFTKVPLKALSDKAWMRHQCFCFLTLLIFNCGFSA